MTVPEHKTVIAVTANVSFAKTVSSLLAGLADLFTRSVVR